MRRLTSVLGIGAIAATTAAMVIISIGGAPLAGAEDNGVGATPALGWSSWSYVRHNPTAATIAAQADAMKSSGLASVGYQYVNVDDFWYQCPGSQGPNVDQYGRWVTDATKFPASGDENGIAVTADYVHHDGLKFGLYVTPGISKQAVDQNAAIEGTPYHADDIATTADEKNYNCKGMVGIDYTKPGAQAFVDSWAKQFASWGVDYVKIDGVGTSDIPDIQAWSDALKTTGRPIHLELSNSLAIGSATTWQQLANGWRTGGDVECYCGPSGASFPLTDWSHVSSRFNQVADWQPYGGPGGFNDYDSIEVGNGSNDGLTPDERKTQMSLWALAASPFILGTDLTQLDPIDLGYLKNRDVLAVDQDAIDASRIANDATSQVFAKTESNGDAVVGLFNTGTAPEPISTTASALGLPNGSTAYQVKDLWTHQSTETAGVIDANVPAHGVAFYRVTPVDNPTHAPPRVSLDVTGLSGLTAGVPATATETFTDEGVLPAQHVRLSLSAPAHWSVHATSPTTLGSVASGQTVRTTFRIVAPPPDQLFASVGLTAKTDYTWHGNLSAHASAPAIATTSPAVQAPYRTYSSAGDAPAHYAQSGTQLGIVGAGADLFSATDAYSSIYLDGAVGTSSTVDAEVTGQQALTGYGKAGIIVRNDMAGSGTSPEGVVLFESPTGGIQLEWNDNGGMYLDAVTPANGTLPDTVPVYLKLERTAADTYTGYYSLDGKGWFTVGSATVPGQADTQDAGLFVNSHAAGSTAQISFDGFAATEGAVPPPPGPKSYEAESASNAITGGARVANCSACSGGKKVGFVGNGGVLTFNGVTAPSDGDYDVTIAYLNGPPGRQAVVSADGGPGQTLSFTPTTDFNTLGTRTVTLHLTSGDNTVTFANPSDYGPDFDRILVAALPN